MSGTICWGGLEKDLWVLECGHRQTWGQHTAWSYQSSRDPFHPHKTPLVTEPGCFFFLLSRLQTHYMHPTTFCFRPCASTRVLEHERILLKKQARRVRYQMIKANMNVIQAEQEVKLSKRDKQESLCFHTCEDTPGVHWLLSCGIANTQAAETKR